MKYLLWAEDRVLSGPEGHGVNAHAGVSLVVLMTGLDGRLLPGGVGNLQGVTGRSVGIDLDQACLPIGDAGLGVQENKRVGPVLLIDHHSAGRVEIPADPPCVDGLPLGRVDLDTGVPGVPQDDSAIGENVQASVGPFVFARDSPTGFGPRRCPRWCRGPPPTHRRFPRPLPRSMQRRESQRIEGERSGREEGLAAWDRFRGGLSRDC